MTQSLRQNKTVQTMIAIVIFLIINFAALGIGGLFTSAGVPSVWYQALSKAPWTPPGWVFGMAWTIIMICLSVFMAKAWNQANNKSLLILLFVIQWVLNVAWNPIFFKFQFVVLGLIVILSLTLIVGLLITNFAGQMEGWTWLLAPYFIWLLIASSLNWFIYMNN